MILRPGQVVEYWAGLGGSRLAEGTIRRIEQVLTLDPDAGIPEFDTEAERLVFVDFTDGRWTYSARIARIVAEP